MTDTPSRDLRDAALFCLGMASALCEAARNARTLAECPLNLEAVKELENVYWDHRHSPLSAAAQRLNALNPAPVQIGSFVRPNAHLICFDVAKNVLDAIWKSVDFEGYQKAHDLGFDGSVRMDLTGFADRWRSVAEALRSLHLPDHRSIISAVEQEFARLSVNAGIDFIDQLLAGPDDVELTPREMARLEAHLKQPISFAAIHSEMRATGRSPTNERRNKLKHIWNFNRALTRARPSLNTPDQEQSRTRSITPPQTERSLLGCIDALLAFAVASEDHTLNADEQKKLYSLDHAIGEQCNKFGLRLPEPTSAKTPDSGYLPNSKLPYRVLLHPWSNPPRDPGPSPGAVHLLLCPVLTWHQEMQGLRATAEELLHREGVSVPDDLREAIPTASSAGQTRPKRSTERGEGRAKLSAALTKHHEYANDECLNLEPIGNNELARLAGVKQATASAFFKKEFQGHGKYKALCRDKHGLVAALKMLNNEYSPHHLYGPRPPGERDHDDDVDS